MSRVKREASVLRPNPQLPPIDAWRAIAGFDTRDVVAAPELLSKLPPRKPPAPSIRGPRSRCAPGERA